jgi:hypothetical protein
MVCIGVVWITQEIRPGKAAQGPVVVPHGARVSGKRKAAHSGERALTTLAELATATRTRVRVEEHAFDKLAHLTPLQERAFQLLEVPWR